MKVHSLVECVHRFSARIPGETFPEKGQIYTVRAVRFFPRGEVGILLQEIHNEPGQYEDEFGETHFSTLNFKEVQTPEEGQKIFNKENLFKYK